MEQVPPFCDPPTLLRTPMQIYVIDQVIDWLHKLAVHSTPNGRLATPVATPFRFQKLKFFWNLKLWARSIKCVSPILGAPQMPPHYSKPSAATDCDLIELNSNRATTHWKHSMFNSLVWKCKTSNLVLFIYDNMNT